MKPYGSTRHENGTCPYGCCTGPKCAKKYTRKKAKPRSAGTDRRARKAARREARRQIRVVSTVA